jgi:amino acid adenylation domain-containing protein
LSPQSCEALRLIAQQAGVPLKSALLAVHLKVLSLMTGRDDVVTGLVTNCRPEDEEGSENLLGLFLNTLPMRTALPRGSWLDLVRHTFAEEREMLPHRWYPMSRIRQAGQAGSLFEAAFNYVRFHRYGELSTRSDLTVLETGFHGDTNLPLMTDFMQDPVSGRIELSIAFDSSRYDTTFIEAMVDRYRRALDALTEGPDLPHSADAVLSEAERDLLARAAQGPCVPASTTQTANAGDARPTADALTAAVESALRTHADRPAINADGRTVDYGELAATARTCGAAVRAALACTDRGAGSTVALLLPRGIELVTVALGCLLAGVPFVVCDPAQAPERLHRALVDADAGLVVAGSDDLATALPAGVPCYPPHRLRAAPDPGPPAAPHPDDLAYLVFTSGSTGRPKPVAVTRRALANRLDWSQRAYPLQPEDRVLALASPVFDFAIWECFAPLLAGACVVAAPDLMDSGTGLGDLLRQTGTTVAHLVPSLLGGLVDDPALAHCTRLRLLLVGGETFPTSLLDQLRTVLSCEVINQYGPAEATIDATFHRVGAPRHTPADRSGSTVPIGRPIDNVSIHLLGENLLRVPPGCVGEVFIGGAAVARGYHGRPGATAAAFLPDPWTGTPGARMYRTGDLARLLPDGALEFLGRIDDQVQVNGVRVELGEVEAALREGGLVEQAVVVAHRSGRGALQLVAHAVARPGSAVSGEQVLAGLDGLPRALRPARVVLRSELPRTASGKIDRRALEAIGTTESPGGRPRLPAPPTTGLERRLAELWSQVLDTPDPGVEDDFFDLGGDSISALQLVARGRRDGIGLTPRLIYAHRTIRTVARALEAVVLSPAAAEPAAGAALVSLRQGSGATPFFCVHASNGSSAPYAALAAALPRPRPFFGLDAEGLRPDGPELASVPALAAHYLAQVRDRQPQGPYLFGGWSTGGAIAFEMAVQARAQGEEVAALILLDPSVPPMLAGPPEHALLLWLFLRDLAGLTGRPMPALTVDRLRSLEPGARVAATIEAIREAALVPEEVVDQLAAQMDVFCALVGAAAVWNPRRYDGPLTLLVAGSDEEAQHRLTGWRSFTGADAVAHAVGGTHHTMLRRPALDGLAPLLDQCLTTATGTGTTP